MILNTACRALFVGSTHGVWRSALNHDAVSVSVLRLLNINVAVVVSGLLNEIS